MQLTVVVGGYWTLQPWRHNLSNVGGINAGQAIQKSSNVGGVTAGQVRHYSSMINNKITTAATTVCNR